MKNKMLIPIAFLALSLMGCQANEPWHSKEDVVLVEVDGRPVTLPMLEFMMDNKGITEEDTDGMRELLEELIRLRVVANAAETDGLADQKMLRAERAIKDMEALQIAYFKQVYEQFPVTDERIEEAYRAQVARAGQFQYQLETISFVDQPQALSALLQLEEGAETFESLITEAKANGREVMTSPWVDQSQVPDRFAAALVRSQVGSIVTLPLPAPNGAGWLVTRIADRRGLSAPPIDQVREGIARSLVRQRLDALVEDLYAAADIVPMLEAGGEPGEER
jgi:peptidyl-prolyl cis-trans isomerase C